MDSPAFAPASLEIARRNLRTIFEAFGKATGYPPTFVGFIARGEPKWARQFEDRDFTHTSYDTAVSRLSALWPEGAEWPPEVPRLAPAEEIPSEILERIKAREDRRETDRKPDPAALPGGATWPDDIPRPGQSSPADDEGGRDGQENESR